VVVAGAEPYAGISKLLAKKGLSKTVTFIGRVRNMQECYAGSDVLVLPTFYDACSLVVFEAMACGLPCITTKANGAAGIITDGYDGFILDHPPQPEQLANKMALLLQPTQRERMGHAAAKTALDYTIERNHQGILRILNEVAGARDNAHRK